MLRASVLVAAIVIAPVCAVRAADNGLPQTGAPGTVTLVQGGGFGLSGPAYNIPLTGVSGLFGWGSGYRLDASVQQNLTGGYTAGFGANMGARPGELGSAYSLRLGGGWTGDWFSANPVSALGMSEPVTPAQDMSLSFSYNRSITPSLSVTGTAEAYYPVNASALDPLGGTSQVVIGAGIGLRF